VADEEMASLGMEDVLKRHRPHSAIVTEPTALALCTAHKGFSWIAVETIGRAAHGSRFDEGIDANLRMGRFLAELEKLERDLRHRPPHPLVGPPSLHAGVLRGGTAPSVYAARCRLDVERRRIPGETDGQALAELQAIADRLAAADPTFRAELTPGLARDPFEVPGDAAIVQAVERAAAEVLGRTPERVGQGGWMDSALLAGAGVETVVIGADGAGAHADEEWVDLDSVAKLAEILVRAAVEHCGPAVPV
jgi:acetylornithine deacetylase